MFEPDYFRDPSWVDWGCPINWGSGLNRNLALWYLAAPNAMGWGSNKVRDLCRKNDGTLTNMTPGTSWIGPLSARGSFGALKFASAAAMEVSFSSFVLAETSPWTVWWRSTLTSYGDSFPGEWSLKTGQATGFIVFHNTADSSYRPLSFGSDSNFVTQKASTDWSSSIVGVPQTYALTFDGASISTAGSYALYRNGNAETIGATGGGFASVPNVSHLGYASANSTEFDGNLPEFRILTRCLSAREVAAYHAEAIAGYPTVLNRVPLPRLSPEQSAAAIIGRGLTRSLGLSRLSLVG